MLVMIEILVKNAAGPEVAIPPNHSAIPPCIGGRLQSLRIGVLAYPGCFASEVFGVPDLLTFANRVAVLQGPNRARYEATIVSPRRRVVAAGGLSLNVSAMCPVDILVVPGFDLSPTVEWDPVLAGLQPELASIRSSADAGIPIVSICVGALLLAEAGLLDGRQATT